VAGRPPEAGPVSVLLAEHEPEVAEMSARFLRRDGLRVRLVTSPEQALAELAGGPDAAAVVDLTMPGLDLRRIRRAVRTPVIFLVADLAGPRPRGLAAKGDAAAARRWLARPFSPRQLVATVRDVLTQTRPARTASPTATPTVTAPAGTAPAVTAPAVTAPTVTAPAGTAPAVTAPTVTAPTVTAPAGTAPAVTAPAVTAPAVTAPAGTAPTVTAPAATTLTGTPPAGTAPGPAVQAGAAGRAPAVPGQRSAGELRLDGTSRSVIADGRRVPLTATEYALLALMMDNPGRVLSRQRLLAAAVGRQNTGDRAADVHIAQLRAKIGADPRTGVIRTVRGAGYALDP
jgi:DNA-binding response OmpR family regulator